jgi:hypothetical protein
MFKFFRRVLIWLLSRSPIELISESKLTDEEMALINSNGSISLSDAELNVFKKAMKIGFFKSFYKDGLIDATQLDRLIQMQNK